MPLTAAEKGVARSILRLLPEEEMHALAETVCQRLVAHPSAAEAEEVVLEFSADLTQLLRRQKMKRERLLRWALTTGVAGVDVNSEKRTLVRRIADHASGGSAAPVAVAAPDAVHEPEVDDAGVSSQENDNRVQTMALRFAEWFFSLLNAESGPTNTDRPPSDVFGPQHFCDAAALNLRVADNAAQHAETLRGASVVAARLRSFVANDGVLFGPNLSPEGCRGKKEPHGLVLLRIKGTLNKGSGLVGVFDQSFGLVKEIASEQWKVQVTYLQMIAGVGGDGAVDAAGQVAPQPALSGQTSLPRLQY